MYRNTVDVSKLTGLLTIYTFKFAFTIMLGYSCENSLNYEDYRRIEKAILFLDQLMMLKLFVYGNDGGYFFTYYKTKKWNT